VNCRLFPYHHLEARTLSGKKTACKHVGGERADNNNNNNNNKIIIIPSHITCLATLVNMLANTLKV